MEKSKTKTSKREIELQRIPKREIDLQRLTLASTPAPAPPAAAAKEFKPINEQEFKNYKRNSPLYFKKKLRRSATQKFKPEEEADAIPLYEKDEEHFDEEEQKVTEYDDSEEERKSPIDDIRKRRGDSPLMHSQNLREKLVRERNKKSGKMVPFGGKKTRRARRTSSRKKRLKTKKNKRYITKK